MNPRGAGNKKTPSFPHAFSGNPGGVKLTSAKSRPPVPNLDAGFRRNDLFLFLAISLSPSLSLSLFPRSTLLAISHTLICTSSPNLLLSKSPCLFSRQLVSHLLRHFRRKT